MLQCLPACLPVFVEPEESLSCSSIIRHYFISWASWILSTNSHRVSGFPLHIRPFSESVCCLQAFRISFCACKKSGPIAFLSYSSILRFGNNTYFFFFGTSINFYQTMRRHMPENNSYTSHIWLVHVHFSPPAAAHECCLYFLGGRGYLTPLSKSKLIHTASDDRITDKWWTSRDFVENFWA
jgi:hypothetical protein